MNKTEEEIQKEFQENFSKVKACYANRPEGVSGYGGYTPGPCHNGLISMKCANVNKCICHQNSLSNSDSKGK